MVYVMEVAVAKVAAAVVPVFWTTALTDRTSELAVALPNSNTSFVTGAAPDVRL
jgi:hypothetical protein